MIDNDLMPDPIPARTTSEKELVAALLQNDLVRLYRYADSGPPAAVSPSEGNPEYFDGWAVVSDKSHGDLRTVLHAESGTYSQSGVLRSSVDWAERDTTSKEYRNLGLEGAAAQRRADGLAAAVAAQALSADIYITGRPYLLSTDRQLSRSTTICDARTALHLVSLYLRRQGEYRVGRYDRFQRWLFYWVGTRELLPESWRWFSECVQHSGHVSDDSLQLLASALLQRVTRALQTRDAVHFALNQDQSINAREESLTSLDTTLVLLMGAIDVSARVANYVLKIKTPEHAVGWQRKGWRDQVSAKAPPLAQLVDNGTKGEHTLTILRLLRNTVHGEALQGSSVVKSGEAQRSLVGLPANDAMAVLSAMASTGGHSSWGVQPRQHGRVLVEPGVLVDRLFEYVLDLLNALMVQTPVETLSGSALTVSNHSPPNEPDSPFAQWRRQGIRWQLGF